MNGTKPPPEGSVAAALSRRRAVRHYDPEPVSRELLIELLDQVRLTPSGWNLQPVHFVLVTDSEQKRLLRRACLGQPHIEQAPAVVVFATDLEPHCGRLEAILARDLENGSVTPEYAKFSDRTIRLLFKSGPLGLVGAAKRAAIHLMSWFRPMPAPNLSRHQRRIWSLRQAAMAAQTFLLLAADHGLASCPLEGFDPRRVRRVLEIPQRYMVALVVTVGRAGAPQRPRRSRLPLTEILHEERF